MTGVRRAGAAAALLTGLLALSGCYGATVERGSSGSPTAGPDGPLVAEDVVHLDLREAPTAQEAGIGPDRRDLILSRVGEAIDTQLELPGGRLDLDAFGVNIGGPIGDPAPSYARRIVVNVRSGDTAEVEQLLLGQAEVLGIDPDAVREWAARSTKPRPYGENHFFEAPAPSGGGPVITVEVRWEDSQGHWTLNYGFSFSGPPASRA